MAKIRQWVGQFIGLTANWRSSDLGEEHGLAVVGVVARGLPQLDVHDLRRDDLAVAVAALKLAHVIDERVVDDRPLGMEERRSPARAG